MKIYAIKDRLIDYFLTPFAAPGDKEVMASVAATINRPGNNDAIAQAPHHFEVWSLGHVTEDGHLVPEREFLGDCSSLVRRGVREGGGTPTAEQLARHGGAVLGTPTGTPSRAGTHPGVLEREVPGEGRTPQAPAGHDQGGDRRPDWRD